MSAAILVKQDAGGSNENVAIEMPQGAQMALDRDRVSDNFDHGARVNCGSE